MAPTNEKVRNNIPDDLALNILSKLPVKSLKRFRCVHKSWSSLFENPHFMSIYRRNFISKNDNSSLLLKQQMKSTHRENLFLLSDEKFENRVKLDWPPPFQEDDRNIFILGSCINGTICLYQGPDVGPDIRQKVVFWNPATEEFRVIPFGPVECPLGVDICVDLQGFGYDHVRDDYKVIRFLYFFEDRFQHVENRPDVPDSFWQIYSQKSNSWRKLDVEMINRIPAPNGSEVYLNGVCHWLGLEERNQEELLVSFNMSDEVFHTTSIDSHAFRFVRRHLVVLNESIAMITNYIESNCFDILVLGELGVKESWTKLFTIGPLPCVELPIGVGRKGDILFGKNDDELAWYDISNQMIREIGVKGEAYCCQIAIYKESLLPIGGINH